MLNEPVGLIGIGLLGSAMAERLLAAGFSVTGHDVVPQRVAEFEAAGGLVVASAKEVALACRRIVLSLPNSSICSQILAEICPVLGPDSLVIDTTTGSPADAESAALLLGSRGAGYMDASVGGSSKQTRAGDVLVLVGAQVKHFNAAQDIFATFARKTFHLGPPGYGARMKLVFNMVLGLNRAVLAEGLAFAEHYGLQADAALEILKGGATYSTVMDFKGDKMVRREYSPPEARLSQHLKDVRLMLDAAAANGAHTPLTELHEKLLERAEELGFGQADNSAVIEVFRPLGLGAD